MLQGLYLLFSVLGLALPYSQFIPFLIEHGLDIRLFFEQLFANKISSFFGMDLFISSFGLWIFIFTEGSRLKMRMLWIYIVSNLVVGVSLALPLFLLMRQRQIEHKLVNATSSSD